ncbi:MAG: hypothetical protein MZV63_57855 [Marinilabiliales bacterium]|nr:hypothetical protein [Marinilabiliales bacterium]
MKKKDIQAISSPLFFLILALIIGAATRHFLKKAPLPYRFCYWLLVLDLALLSRLGFLGNWNLGFLKINVSFYKQFNKLGWKH